MLTRIISLILLILLIPILVIISILIYLADGFPIIFKQKRVGVYNSEFIIYKFRTMKKDMSDIPTHLLKNSNNVYIKFGLFFRKYSFDELPQLLNIIKGDIVFIGPRPALHNQGDLIDLRTESDIHLIKPGITGWSQVNGRDNLTINEKVEYDLFYVKNRSLLLNLTILIKTISQLIRPKGISQ